MMFPPGMTIVTRNSKPEIVDAPSFLNLLPEIRNNVYSWLLRHPSPAHIKVNLRWTQGNPTFSLRAVLPVAPLVPLFQSCRQVYHEAASVYYSENTFVLTKQHYQYDCGRDYVERGGLMWLTSLGDQVQWIRKLVIDLDGLCPSQCTAALTHHQPAFEPKDNMINFGPLILALWSHGLRVDISVEQPKGGFFSATKNMHSSLRLTNKDYECNTIGISAILRSLVDDGQDLKKYGPQISALGIRRDGEGGVVRWGTTRCSNCRALKPHGCDQCRSDVTVHSASETPFSLWGRERRIVLKHCKEPNNFMTLPECIRYRIIELALHGLTTHIDLDTQTKFNLGLPHVSKTMYAKHWNQFLSLSSLELVMTSHNNQTTFSNFGALRQVLRKAFKPYGPLNQTNPATILLEEVMQMRFVLRFRLEVQCSLEDISISILPFVMETSTAPGTQEVMTEILDKHGLLIANHTVSLQQLRLTAVKELMDVVFMTSGSKSCRRPEIWVDGFGKVLKSSALPSPTATALKKQNAPTLTEKDRRYRGTRLDRCNCYDKTKNFFPFEDSASETLRYLLWVLECKTRANLPTIL
jgi:hypothetical protein